MKIEITPERQKIIDSTFSKWKKVGLCTDEANFEATEDAVTTLYKFANLDRPCFMHLNSPLAAELYINSLGETGAVHMDMRRQFRSYLRRQLEDQIRRQIGGQLRNQLRFKFGGQLRGLLENQLGDVLSNQLRERFFKSKFTYTDTWNYGAWDAWLWGYFDCARRLDVEYSDVTATLLDAHCKITYSCGAIYTFKDFCILANRPHKITLDNQGLVHCEDGPAILYREGFSIYSWHGLQIPTGWLDRTALTPIIALTHDNIEQRRAACEILGWDVILDELNATTIDKDEDPLIGELVEVVINEINAPEIAIIPSKFLRVTCGTGRNFTLPVPPDMTTALQANAWTYGLDDYQYKPEIRT